MSLNPMDYWGKTCWDPDRRSIITVLCLSTHQLPVIVDWTQGSVTKYTESVDKYVLERFTKPENKIGNLSIKSFSLDPVYVEKKLLTATHGSWIKLINIKFNNESVGLYVDRVVGLGMSTCPYFVTLGSTPAVRELPGVTIPFQTVRQLELQLKET